ncbi:exosome complex component Rrp46p [[Candida] jaroonii]|uniref:Exosome complex component Rrp46p n=1 Tax=[Candida] jaroonii TaxID=467808 RepID=A0ACA9Y593_9ASCO|nr:exosome complex component Rrp46p [[Candida] jaroonii]
MHLKTSTLSNFDGSAELQSGNSKVIVSINGPIEPKPKQELPNVCSLEINLHPSQGLSTTRENLLVDKIRSILSSLIIKYKYPRQLISINIQIIRSELDSIIINNFENSPKDLKIFNFELSTILNCCYFALIDANIALYESFISIHSCIVNKQIKLNPSLEDLIECGSNHIIVLSIKDNQPNKIIFIDSKGKFSEKELLDVIDYNFNSAVGIFSEFKRLIDIKIDNDFVWKN